MKSIERQRRIANPALPGKLPSHFTPVPDRPALVQNDFTRVPGHAAAVPGYSAAVLNIRARVPND